MSCFYSCRLVAKHSELRCKTNLTNEISVCHKASHDNTFISGESRIEFTLVQTSFPLYYCLMFFNDKPRYRFWRETKFRSMHFFSCNLAMADIFVSTLSLPTQVSSSIHNRNDFTSPIISGGVVQQPLLNYKDTKFI